MGRKKKLTRKRGLGESVAIGLNDWFKEVKAVHAQGSRADKGACLIKNPLTGQSYCVQTTRDACKTLKGSWVGGPCGF